MDLPPFPCHADVVAGTTDPSGLESPFVDSAAAAEESDPILGRRPVSRTLVLQLRGGTGSSTPRQCGTAWIWPVLQVRLNLFFVNGIRIMLSVGTITLAHW